MTRCWIPRWRGVAIFRCCCRPSPSTRAAPKAAHRQPSIAEVRAQRRPGRGQWRGGCQWTDARMAQLLDAGRRTHAQCHRSRSGAAGRTVRRHRLFHRAGVVHLRLVRRRAGRPGDARGLRRTRSVFVGATALELGDVLAVPVYGIHARHRGAGDGRRNREPGRAQAAADLGLAGCCWPCGRCSPRCSSHRTGAAISACSHCCSRQWRAYRSMHSVPAA